MKSKISEALKMPLSPVAVVFTDDKPEGAVQFKEGRWGCAASMVVAAAKGKTVVFDRNTFGCLGGGTGLGFGDQYAKFPGGIEYFLSTGNKEFCNSEMGKNIVRNMPALEEGERYLKSPELAKEFVDKLPMTDVLTEFIVFKPIDEVKEDESPKVVVFLVNPDRLSALVVLANYGRGGNNDTVIAPFGAGCHSIGIFPYAEDENNPPRAVLGMFDISARKQLDSDLLSFTVPYKMFEEMEENVTGSFLEKENWEKVLKRNM